MGAVTSKEYTQTDPARRLIRGSNLWANIFEFLPARSVTFAGTGMRFT
jgi:hypothetical protein